MRKQQFKRPEPNFSMYEGRTRGKRMKYTYSDDEDEDDIYSDSTSRRSTRNTGTHTPAEPAGPTVTLSGRQVRSRHGGTYGESMLSDTHAPSISVGGYDGANEQLKNGDSMNGRRPRRAAAANQLSGGKASIGSRHIGEYNSADDMDDEDDASEQDYGDDEDEDIASLASEDDNGEHSDDDVDMNDDAVEFEGNDKSPVAVLPDNTPTPENKPSIKLKLSPEKRPTDANATGSAETSPVPKPLDGPVSCSGTSTATQQVSSASKAETAAQIPNAAATGNSQRVPSNPLSPSLAYRGSPEKSHAFPQPIHVGQGRS